MSAVPDSVSTAVLVSSEKLPDDTPVVKGYDFNNGLDHGEMLEAMLTSGFQATNFGKSVLQVKTSRLV
eukprot:2838163-Pyramimonas_sp.AAC.1